MHGLSLEYTCAITHNTTIHTPTFELLNNAMVVPGDIETKYLARLLPVLKHKGFAHLRIDAMARYMDISKATFYKYFASKDAVVERVVTLALAYFAVTSQSLGDATIPVLTRFQQMIGQSLTLASYLTEVFLIDLRQGYSPLWAQLKEAEATRVVRLIDFCKQGMEIGLFHRANPALLILQTDVMIRALFNPYVLMERGLTLEAALNDFYDLQKAIWLPTERRSESDDAPIRETIASLAQKASLEMHTSALR